MLVLLLNEGNIGKQQVLLGAALVLLHRHLVQIGGLVLYHGLWTKKGRVAEEVLAPLVVETRGFDLHLVDLVDKDGLVGRELVVVVLKLVFEAALVFVQRLQVVRLVETLPESALAFLLTAIARPYYLIDLLHVPLVVVEVYRGRLVILGP